MNVTPYILLETKGLHEILNLWGGRGVRKASTHLFFPSSLLLIHEFQEIQPLRLQWPHVGNIYLMADFTVTSFPLLLLKGLWEDTSLSLLLFDNPVYSLVCGNITSVSASISREASSLCVSMSSHRFHLCLCFLFF